MARRLLVVDDEEHIRFTLARALARHGYQVFVADNGADALAQLARVDVDTVVSDVMMPTMTGIELGYRITGSYPWLPLLFLTGSEVPPDLLALPLVRLVRKPTTIRDVVRRLDELQALVAHTDHHRRKGSDQQSSKTGSGDVDHR